MKITQLFKIYWPDNGGGIAKVMESIADGLSDYEHQIIVCQDSRHKKSSSCKYNGISVRRCRQLFEVVSTPVSLQFLYDVKKRTKDSDIVIYHFPYPMADLAVLLGMYSGRLVVWWHCGFDKYKMLAMIYQLLVKHTLKKADLILVSSKANIRNSRLLRSFHRKCRVIPFCVSDAYLKKGENYVKKQQKEKRGDPCIRILFVGRLVWYKGCDILLRAFARMRNKNCCLILAGNGPLEAQLKSLAASLRLKQVEFTGMISEAEKMKQMQACDFLVLPSVSKAEAFAIVQIEAMAFAKPVINTALQSGVPDVSVDGVTGITVKPGNVRELARAMDKLAGNDKLRRVYGINAQKRVQKEYTQKIMSERCRKVFQELLQQKSLEEANEACI